MKKTAYLRHIRLSFFLILNLAGCLMQTTLANTPDAGALIAKGDVYDARFLPDRALEYYLPAVMLRPDDAALLIKIARQYVYRMDALPTAKEKLSAGRVALDYAERATRAAPGESDAHLSIAISLGKLSQLQSNREKVAASKRIRDSSQRAIELNPRNDYAWHLLGRWHQAMAGMSGVIRSIAEWVYGQMPEASNEEAVRCFQKAISLKPDRLIHHIELGRTYAQMGRSAEARAALQRGLAMPEREKDDPETKARGRACLATLD